MTRLDDHHTRIDILGTITFAILVISLVAVIGLAVGSVRVRGIGLGPAGVLFAGLVFGNFGAAIDHQVAGFAKEFGLILFVYTIGLQLGPGIVQLWKQQGLFLNAQAMAIVLQGVGLVLVLLLVMKLPAETAAGLFSGATTNTPSLGAAEQAASMVGKDSTEVRLSALTAAYAVAYPGGILGIIGSMILLRRLFRIDLNEEAEQLRAKSRSERVPIERAVILVDNSHLHGVPFCRIPGVEETGVRISRVRRADEEDVHPATQETEIYLRDAVQVVGSRAGLERFAPLTGQTIDLDMMNGRGDAEFRRISVTDSRALNRPLHDLALDHLYSATITRIDRAGIQMTPRGTSRLHFGDVVQVVGDRISLDRVTELLGNSKKSLSETPFSPLLVGVLLGVVLGMVPFYFPGLPFPVRLGLAGGAVDRGHRVQSDRQHWKFRLVHPTFGQPGAP